MHHLSHTGLGLRPKPARQSQVSTDRNQHLHALHALHALRALRAGCVGQQQLEVLSRCHFTEDLTAWRVEPVVTHQR